MKNEYQGGTCWLKNTIGNSFPKSGVSSGVVNVQCSTAIPDTDSNGIDIANMKGASSDCCSKCANTNACVAWAWVRI